MICGSTRNTDHQREKSTFYALYPIISVREEKNRFESPVSEYAAVRWAAQQHEDKLYTDTDTDTRILH